MSTDVSSFKDHFSYYKEHVSMASKVLMECNQKAFEKFELLGLPDSKNENWKYTNVAPIIKRAFVSQTQELVSPQINNNNDIFKFEFEAGKLKYAPKTSQFKWQALSARTLDMLTLKETFQPLSKVTDGFHALSLSMPSDILMIEVPANTELKDPIYLQLSDPETNGEGLIQPQIYIRLGAGAVAHFLEQQNSKSNGLVNANIQISLDENARMHFVKQVTASEASISLSQYHVEQGRDSFCQFSFFTTGGSILRNAITINQSGEGAETICNGLYLTKNKEHADFRVKVQHLKPHGVSRQLFKGVLKDNSRAVFNGKIYIEKYAQKVDSSQLNSNLVLSRGAEADSKPELEVYADDVKANHGSAIGQLDEDQLFYLMSRAISKNEAIKILAKGFVEEVALKVQSSALRVHVYEWLDAALVNFQQSLESSSGGS